MTYPDKTVYPISSRNDKDFLNLTSVYLDAVLHQKFLKIRISFIRKEFILNLMRKILLIKGVVFNEMKGAMSGVDEQE